MSRKALYKAASLDELKRIATIPIRFNSLKGLQNAMSECFRQANDCCEIDEEAAYILYMRYFDCYERLKQLTDNKMRQSVFTAAFKKQLLQAIDQLESLHRSLKARYDELNDLQLEDMLPSPPRSSPTLNSLKDEKSDQPAPSQPHGWISVAELASAVRKKRKMLVIDLRSENEFEACHMKYKDVISFPADKYLSSGTTFSTVSSLISRGPSKGAWDTRGDYEAVVLLDQSTNSGGSNRSVLETLKPSHPLLLMKDAIYKWDAQHVVKTEPVVLDGGMQEFLLRYAPLTTNPDYCVHPPNADGTESSKRLLDGQSHLWFSFILLQNTVI